MRDAVIAIEATEAAAARAAQQVPLAHRPCPLGVRGRRLGRAARRSGGSGGTETARKEKEAETEARAEAPRHREAERQSPECLRP